jgi:hypothetical protein
MPFHRFYVPVGPRGILLKAGMILPGALGPLAYWWAWRRREEAPPPSLVDRPGTPDVERT